MTLIHQEVVLSDQGTSVKRGQLLFEEGQTLDRVYVIQKGQISLNVVRNGMKIEIAQMRPGTMIGDEALFHNTKAFYNAEAMSPVSFLEVPYSVLKKQYEGAQGGVKMLIKSFSDELKTFRQKAKSLGLENESTPCPDKLVPRLFSSVSLIAQHLGKVNEEGNMELDWAAMKLYGTRFFMETPKRMTEVLKLLSKLGYIKLFYELNDDEIEELATIQFDKIEAAEEFAQFYQYYLYKGGKSESIIVDRTAILLAKGFAECSEDLDSDFRGAVLLDYVKIVSHLLEEYQINLNANHINLLEKKGLFIKLMNQDDGVKMSFDRNEFLEAQKNWEVLYEIKQWNDKGSVDLEDDSLYAVDKPVELKCPECEEPIGEASKFCSECGYKLAA